VRSLRVYGEDARCVGYRKEPIQTGRCRYIVVSQPLSGNEANPTPHFAVGSEIRILDENAENKVESPTAAAGRADAPRESAIFVPTVPEIAPAKAGLRRYAGLELVVCGTIISGHGAIRRTRADSPLASVRAQT